MKLKIGFYHFVALSVVIIWGVTFISTKLILLAGLSPSDIFFYRFLLAYIGILFFGKNKLFADNLKDECLFILLGVAGGSGNFMFENYALQNTQASNVALLVCTAPLLTVLLTGLFPKQEKINRRLITGFCMAFLGAVLVILNGHFVLKISLLGDILSLGAATCWAFYSILFTTIKDRYPTLFITRKVFFYGLISIIPVFIWKPLTTDTSLIFQPIVIGNILFLGILASLICYFFWNLTLKKLGALMTNNYIHIIPLITLLTSSLLIHEKITVFAIAGMALILSGVIYVERHNNLKNNK